MADTVSIQAACLLQRPLEIVEKVIGLFYGVGLAPLGFNTGNYTMVGPFPLAAGT